MKIKQLRKKVAKEKADGLRRLLSRVEEAAAPDPKLVESLKRQQRSARRLAKGK